MFNGFMSVKTPSLHSEIFRNYSQYIFLRASAFIPLRGVVIGKVSTREINSEVCFRYSGRLAYIFVIETLFWYSAVVVLYSCASAFCPGTTQWAKSKRIRELFIPSSAKKSSSLFSSTLDSLVLYFF